MKRSTEKKKQPKNLIKRIGNIFIPVPTIISLVLGIGCLFCASGHSLDAVINSWQLSGIGIGLLLAVIFYVISIVVKSFREK